MRGITAELSKNKQANRAKIFSEPTPCFFLADRFQDFVKKTSVSIFRV